MRIVAYFFLCSGVFLLLGAAYGEYRGVAIAAAPTELPGIIGTAKRAQNPKEFRNLMNYQWIESGMTFFVGLFALALVRRP